ncbi:carboxypeptidase-like regulatory domain-containing protein [Edaphobacter aggregans]|uniref:carboxypeptidase-like regulatory domain-containing protein n=1 Tax=Edaphobacter aggregans TaxID=570835 RepID=UPI000A005566|nr:carboxypeptidase-like regulatory domain-containing protein [Edaphobacter aggregans]
MTAFTRKLSFLVILILGIDFATVHGQVQATNGSIRGDVVDASGAVVPDTSVEATEIDIGIVHLAVTDGYGHFDFPSLPPGRYVVKISKTGFTTTVQENLNLTVGRTISLKLILQVERRGAVPSHSIFRMHPPSQARRFNRLATPISVIMNLPSTRRIHGRSSLGSL